MHRVTIVHVSTPAEQVGGSSPPAEPVRGGYWIIPIGLILGFGTLVLTHRGARAFLGWWRRRSVKRG